MITFTAIILEENEERWELNDIHFSLITELLRKTQTLETTFKKLEQQRCAQSQISKKEPLT